MYPANVETNKVNTRSGPGAWARSLGDLAELRFVTAMILLVLVVTSLPYIYAHVTTPQDKQFMGMMLDVPDHMQYFSWMRELSTANLAANKLTPEANEPVFFNLLWWSLGRLGRLLGWGIGAVYQVLRIGAIIASLLMIHFTCKFFLPDRLMQRTAFLVATFAAGFGWLLILLKYTVTDGELLYPLLVYIAEPNTFLSALGYPHFLAASLYILVFLLVLRGYERQDQRYALGAGIWALFLGWQHAYDLIIVYGVLGAFAALVWIRDRRLPRFLVVSGLIIGGISVWPALYSALLTTLDPLWDQVLAQFANAGVYTPSFLQLFILLGPAFILALYTALRDKPLRLQGRSDRDLLLLGWFWISFVLVYIPTDYQIHMLNGWQVPIAILATIGLFRHVVPTLTKYFARGAIKVSKAQLQKWASIALILIVLPTNLYLLVWRFYELSRHEYPYYLYTDEIAAMQWLEANTAPDDVVFSALQTGQYIPAMTGTHAYLAHWAQTVAFYEKTETVDRFFDPATQSNEQQQILADGGVEWVFYGPAERQLGEVDLSSIDGLELRYSGPLVSIFQVK